MSMIKVQNVSKVFRQKRDRRLLREQVRDIVKRPGGEGFYALNDVTFSVEKGESMAVVGANGAGKSTLLAVVCGLARPEEGTVKVDGSIAALLELAAGFHPDLTGRENLMLYAAVLGMSRREALDRFQSIVDFAELNEFIDQPLRTYSSGMAMRLAFSTAVQRDPNVLIIDEILGVGDAAFQTKCRQKLDEFRANGKTLLFVSHSPEAVKSLCDRAIWLHHGRLVMDASAGETAAAYAHFMANPGSPLPDPLGRTAHAAPQPVLAAAAGSHRPVRKRHGA